MHLGLDQMERTERRAGPRELAVWRRDHHVTEREHRPGQHVQTDRVDAVVIGEEDSHEHIVADAVTVRSI